MSEDWRRGLDLDGKNPEVLASAHQVLFRCQYPGVTFPWVQIVHNQGNVYAAKVLPIIIPEDAASGRNCEFLRVLHDVGPANCKVLLLHEKRPYPALVKDAVGETLTDLPGGVIEPGEVVSSGALREFFEESGGGAEIVAYTPILEVPSPASAGAQIEGNSIWAVACKRKGEFKAPADEPIARFELLPLRFAYRELKRRHEGKKECVELKTLGALLMLQQAYYEAWHEMIYLS